MAKRYAKYEELQATSGVWVPSEVLGHHYANVFPRNSSIVVVGSREGNVTLKPGDTLGYNCGVVWVVPRPESFKDPIRRVLAEKRVPQAALQFSSEPVGILEEYGSTYHNSSADATEGDVAVTFGTFDDKIVERSYSEPIGHERSSGYFIRRSLSGGDAVIVRRPRRIDEVTSYRAKRIDRIVVRPSADRQKVADWLREQIPDRR